MLGTCIPPELMHVTEIHADARRGGAEIVKESSEFRKRVVGGSALASM